MNTCNMHNKTVVVYDDITCPMCEVIQDNFRMRTQLLTGAKLANFQITVLPKCIREIFIEISNKKRKNHE